MRPLASILIPTHDRPATLRLAVQSALAQSISQLEVIIIGDGVTDALRQEAFALQSSDQRVVFLDFPKGEHHGESYRHDAILAARSDAIFYLCDDDLFLPDHVSDLLELLVDHNFVQSLNGFIRSSGELEIYPANLKDPLTIHWHLRTDLTSFYNSVSLTGTAHSKGFYLDLDQPWETTPEGRWPDHFQWCKFFSSPDLQAATSSRMTALQLPTTVDGREGWSALERHAELAHWAAIVLCPGAQSLIDERVARASVNTTETAKQQMYGRKAVVARLIPAPLRALVRRVRRGSGSAKARPRSDSGAAQI